ncbi:4-hydroxy-2-oxovalerate aldolase 1 [Striga asiatica]|uniref:4-hydroxy-2-oxovalerate aldolase 1 n=1 Tax=Striga asiatica TaxID=4170 RepID=A0A5A7PGG7_STRAF|nr:4-hydroxy-2-oxovalerate aldolase 1 [Striga asiatica]
MPFLQVKIWGMLRAWRPAVKSPTAGSEGFRQEEVRTRRPVMTSSVRFMVGTRKLVGWVKLSQIIDPVEFNRRTRLPESRISAVVATAAEGGKVALVDQRVRLRPSERTRLPSAEMETRPEESVRGVARLATHMTEVQ